MIPATTAEADLPVELLAGYLDYIAGLDCAQQAKKCRERQGDNRAQAQTGLIR